jgi:hypothetical protein
MERLIAWRGQLDQPCQSMMESVKTRGTSRHCVKPPRISRPTPTTMLSVRVLLLVDAGFLGLGDAHACGIVTNRAKRVCLGILHAASSIMRQRGTQWLARRNNRTVPAKTHRLIQPASIVASRARRDSARQSSAKAKRFWKQDRRATLPHAWGRSWRKLGPGVVGGL